MQLSSRIKGVKESVTLGLSARAKRLKAEGANLIDFSAGEPDFDTPVHIKEAAIKAIREGFTKYTPASGIEKLKEAICKKFKRDNNLQYSPSQIIVSCGAKHSLYNILQVLCQKDDEVIIPSPYWLSYPEMVRLSEARPVILDCDEANDFKLDVGSLKSSINNKTRLIILNSPSNPTGCVYTKDELEAIAEIVLNNNILVVSDEIYEKIIYKGFKHISIASLNKEIFEQTIVVNGVSKSFSMTGWRIGYLATPKKEIVEAVSNLQSHSTSNPTSISQMASLAALEGDKGCIEEMNTEFQRRRDYILNRIKALKLLSCRPPMGSFYLFCRIGKKGLQAAKLAERLLDEAKVVVVPCEAFGSGRHIRLSFATSLENIKEGMDRIKRWERQ